MSAIVAIVMGSKSDLPKLQAGVDTLKELAIPHEVRVISAHRTPERAAEFARGAADRGLQVLIAAAGGAAHLAGALAAQTILPVIGVPVNATPLAGLDALLATVQMPAGIPVATVAIDGGRNAALLAAQIVALGDPALAARLRAQRLEMARAVEAADAAVAGDR